MRTILTITAVLLTLNASGSYGQEDTSDVLVSVVVTLTEDGNIRCSSLENFDRAVDIRRWAAALRFGFGVAELLLEYGPDLLERLTNENAENDEQTSMEFFQTILGECVSRTSQAQTQ